MDTVAKESNGCVDNSNSNNNNNKGVVFVDSEKVDEDRIDGEDDSDSHSLLPPRRGGLSRKSDKTRRKVQWNDRNGNKLVEVLEFVPSDDSDSEDEESDSCICTIM